MELTEEYIVKNNTIYKNNLKAIAAKRGKTLSEISIELGMKRNFVSNACNKKDSLINNGLLHKIMILLNCSISDISEGI